MKIDSNAILADSEAPPAAEALSAGILWGALGVLAFSFTLPATRLAVQSLDPTFVGLGRAIGATALAAIYLAWRRQPLPGRRDLARLLLVGLGAVIGFPLFSALALVSAPAADGAVLIGLLPAGTALMAVWRARERPSRVFWLAVGLGLVAVLVFAAVRGAGLPRPQHALFLLAIASVAYAYAEGAVLARTLGGAVVISWALVLTLPITLPATVVSLLHIGLPQAPAMAWAGFAYTSLVSMYLGFFAWYRGLRQGGVARIGQLQYGQPVLTLLWSALFLGETVGLGTLAAALFVIACAALAQASRVRRPDSPPRPPEP